MSTEDYYKMHEESIRSQKPRIAICYDFDKTLSPDDMQTFTLIPSFGIDKNTFWTESNDLAKENLMDNNLAWMYKLLKYSEFKNKSIKRDYFRKIGAEVPLYKGVNKWFERINKYAESKGIEVEHYIISSGLKEIIEGSPIAKFFTRIYGSTYLYSADNTAIWPAQAINYTNKTQFIFRIAKGCLEEYDESVNKSMPESQLRIPYENIVYIGDSETDIPCMRLVKSKGGYSIGVFDPVKNNRTRVYQLYNDGRLSFFAPADYSARSALFGYLKNIIDEINAKETIKTEQQILSVPVDLYKSYIDIKNISKDKNSAITKTAAKRLESMAENIKALIEGEVD